MTISEHANAIRDALADWVRDNGGSAAVASGEVNMLELLRLKPGGVVAGVLFASEDPRTEHDELGKVDRQFKVVVSRGKGFKLETGESLTDGSGGGKALFILAEEAREVVRGLRFTENEDPEDWKPVYRGIGPWEIQGYVLDALEVRFALGTQIPQQED